MARPALAPLAASPYEEAILFIGDCCKSASDPERTFEWSIYG